MAGGVLPPFFDPTPRFLEGALLVSLSTPPSTTSPLSPSSVGAGVVVAVIVVEGVAVAGVVLSPIKRAMMFLSSISCASLKA